MVVLLLLAAGLALAAAAYTLPGLRQPGKSLAYALTRCPGRDSCARVATTIREPARPFLDLSLRGNGTAGGRRVLGYGATAGGRTLPVFFPYPSNPDIIRVLTGFSSAESLTLTLELDPTVIKGRKAISLLNQETGLLRGQAVVPVPVGLARGRAGGLAEMEVEVLADFEPLSAVLPLTEPKSRCDGVNRGKLPLGRLYQSYVAVGRFRQITATVEEQTVNICIHERLDPELDVRRAQQISRVLRVQREIVGWTPPFLGSHLWVSLFENDVTHGGSVGANTVVTSPDLAVVAHELFHWWNGMAVPVEPEAGWFGEGGTEYYAGKALVRSGFWPAARARQAMLRGDAEFSRETPARLVDLRLASRRGYYNAQYFGGQAVLLWLESAIAQETGGRKSMDDVARLLLQPGQRVTNERIIAAVRAIAAPNAAARLSRMLDGKERIPSVEESWPADSADQAPWR